MTDATDTGSRKNGASTEGRDTFGRFSQGNPGRRKGSRHKVTIAAQKLLDGDAENITRKAIEMALSGDVTALRLCLERILPPMKERPLDFMAPAIESLSDLPEMLAAVLGALGAGTMTLTEADGLAAILERYRRAEETVALADRIQALEARLAN